MMETDLPVCVLICIDVYLGLQKQKLVTKQKIANFAPKILKIPFCCLNFLPRHLEWLFNVIYDRNWCASVCFDLFRCLCWFRGPKCGQNKQKVVDLAPKFQNANFGTLILCWDNPNDSLRSYDWNWSASVCFYLFRCLSWTLEAKIGHK